MEPTRERVAGWALAYLEFADKLIEMVDLTKPHRPLAVAVQEGLDRYAEDASVRAVTS